ncbi:MAG TPA: hypothetical protein VE870_17560, partial [Bacteroidales bacterium]|nr:hypothetical protein [Bacteroidales bacterium]
MELPRSRNYDYDLTNSHFRQWLDEYQHAWESGSPGEAKSLFSEDALYYETPFGPVFCGSEEIMKYWQNV